MKAAIAATSVSTKVRTICERERKREPERERDSRVLNTNSPLIVRVHKEEINHKQTFFGIERLRLSLRGQKGAMKARVSWGGEGVTVLAGGGG